MPINPFRNRTSPTADGKKAEQLAEDHLKKKGLLPISRNYRCKAGEIDLIMVDKDALVFVEVRMRSACGFASAAESVTRTKQARLIRAASHYLLNHPEAAEQPCRFDVIAIDKKAHQADINWIPNAFDTNR